MSYNYFTIFNPLHNLYGYSFALFCLGGFVASHKDRIESVPEAKRNLLSVCGLIVSFACLGLYGAFICKATGSMWDVVWGGMETVFSLIATFCVYLLCLNYKKDLGLIRTIFKNTLGIYLIHSTLIVATKDWLPQVSLLYTFPGTVLYAVVLLFISLGLALLLKYIPGIRRLL